MSEQTRKFTDEEIVANLNLIIEIVNVGAPALAPKLNRTVNYVFSALKEAEKRLEELEDSAKAVAEDPVHTTKSK